MDRKEASKPEMSLPEKLKELIRGQQFRIIRAKPIIDRRRKDDSIDTKEPHIEHIFCTLEAANELRAYGIQVFSPPDDVGGKRVERELREGKLKNYDFSRFGYRVKVSHWQPEPEPEKPKPLVRTMEGVWQPEPELEKPKPKPDDLPARLDKGWGEINDLFWDVDWLGKKQRNQEATGGRSP